MAFACIGQWLIHSAVRMFQLSRQFSEWVIILTDASTLHRIEHCPSVTTCLCTLQAQDPADVQDTLASF